MAGIRTTLAAGAALLIAPAAGLIGPAHAVADQSVVQATIYPGGQGSVTTQTVTADALARCNGYSGGSPFTLEPGGGSYQPATGSSWALGTVVSCGLQIPDAVLTEVQVQSVQHGYEAPFSPASLDDPTQYDDPSAPGALPVVSLDGSQNQVSYARPLRGAGDQNAADRVVGSGPVSIIVYENAAPLTVHITGHRLGVTAAGQRDAFTATVTDTAGHTIAPSSLAYTWNFGDGAGASTASPAHWFGVGNWSVSLLATERGAGTAGTDTVIVGVTQTTLNGARNRPGAGRDRSAQAPTGAAGRHAPAPSPGPPRPGSRTPTQPGPARAGGVPTSGTGGDRGRARAPGSPSVPRSPSAPASAPVTSSSPADPTPPPAAAPRPPVPSLPRRSPARPPKAKPERSVVTGSARLVRGQLIADVMPLPRGSSPLLRTPATVSGAAAIRAATRTTSIAAWWGAVAVAVLLVLGAGQELRGRRRATPERGPII